MQYRPVEERFLDKFSIGRRDKCWPWKGCVSRGYGYIRGERSTDGSKVRNILAHRFAYERALGPVPDGMFVLHYCNNPLCVNPAHLRIGTHRDNMDDLKKSGRAVGRPKRSTLTTKQVATARKMLAMGHTQKDVADKIGVHRTTVQRLMGYMGLMSISQIPRSKLSDEERRQIIELLQKGERVARIAKQFDVDRKTIRNIRDKAKG